MDEPLKVVILHGKKGHFLGVKAPRGVRVKVVHYDQVDKSCDWLTDKDEKGQKCFIQNFYWSDDETLPEVKLVRKDGKWKMKSVEGIEVKIQTEA